MNKTRMQQIFGNYIKKFELINNSEHDENYKWRIAYQFHDLIDPDSPTFPEGLKQAWKVIEDTDIPVEMAAVCCDECCEETFRDGVVVSLQIPTDTGIWLNKGGYDTQEVTTSSEVLKRVTRWVHRAHQAPRFQPQK